MKNVNFFISLLFVCIIGTGIACALPVKMSGVDIPFLSSKPDTKTPDKAPQQVAPTLPAATLPAPTTVPSIPTIALNEINPTVDNNQVTIVLTEEQMTKMANEQIPEDLKATVSNPQITLQNELIQVTGTISKSFLQFNFIISLKPTIAADGSIHVILVAADFGMVNVPQETLQPIIDEINTMINQQIQDSGSNIIWEQVTITDGMMTMVGRNQ